MPANHCQPHTAEARKKMSVSHAGKPNPWRHRPSTVRDGVKLWRCGKCKYFFPREGFYVNKKTLLGITSECRKCHSATNLASRDSERARRANRQYMADRRKRNPEAVREYERGWSGYRRAKRLKATPPWLTALQRAEMRQFYRDTPNGYHVDHIVPLRGKLVWGLHVPWNLQYLPAKVNLQKSNRV